MNYISPNFTHEKLENPAYGDIIDIFEDRMLNWLIEPAQHLLFFQNGTVAAIALLVSYLEGIEIYYTGQDSKGRSKEFFCHGYERIFKPIDQPKKFQKKVLDFLYDQLRCGFAHDAISRECVFFSTVRKEALTFTWPLKDGVFDPNGNPSSVCINPNRFYEGVQNHFIEYVKKLRDDKDQDLKKNFLSAVDLKWCLNKPAPVIGMSEEQFFNRK
jgi:hypothetical protein